MIRTCRFTCCGLPALSTAATFCSGSHTSTCTRIQSGFSSTTSDWSIPRHGIFRSNLRPKMASRFQRIRTAKCRSGGQRLQRGNDIRGESIARRRYATGQIGSLASSGICAMGRSREPKRSIRGKILPIVFPFISSLYGVCEDIIVNYVFFQRFYATVHRVGSLAVVDKSLREHSLEVKVRMERRCILVRLITMDLSLLER